MSGVRSVVGVNLLLQSIITAGKLYEGLVSTCHHYAFNINSFHRHHPQHIQIKTLEESVIHPYKHILVKP
jgi:hypothetical protein